MVSSTWRLGGRGSGLTFQLCSALFFLVQMSIQQRDPVRNFCRRFGHQTAIIDRKLYIDGGFINWSPMSQYPANNSNTWLLYQDLDSSSSSGMPPLYANLSKNDSIPQVSGGVLWADDVNKRFYLYGGALNEASDRLDSFELLSYDVLYDKWDSFGPSKIGIQRLAYGAGVGVSRTGKGYYYGGWMSNATVPGWGGMPAASPYLVTYDYDSNSWSNDTGPDATPRAEGSMVFIPAGDGGMLVYLGGIVDLSGNGTAIQGQSLDKIILYDVLSAKWYIQDASGDVPDMRRRFCMDVTWTADRSSYNIYLYGGLGIARNQQAGFDDVYVLSIPSFTWIKLEPKSRNGTGGYPHHTLTCNIVPRQSHGDYNGAGGGQMLVIGGTFPLTQDCDTPNQWGTHNLDLGMQDPWQIYQAQKVPYAVPSRVVSVIRGGPTGGATASRPSRGWNNPDLGVIITRTGSMLSATRSPTRYIPTYTDQPNAMPLNAGQIAGAAVGATIGLIVTLVSVTTLIRCLRRKKERKRQHQHQHQHQQATMSGQGGAENTHRAELSSDGQRLEKDGIEQTGWQAPMQAATTPGEGSSPVESSNLCLSPISTPHTSTLAEGQASLPNPEVDPPQISELEGSIVPIELVAGSVVDVDAEGLDGSSREGTDFERRQSLELGDVHTQWRPSMPLEDSNAHIPTENHGKSEVVSPLSACGHPPFDPPRRGWTPQVSQLEMPFLPSIQGGLSQGSWRVLLEDDEEFSHSPQSMEPVVSGRGVLEAPNPEVQGHQLRETLALPNHSTGPTIKERRLTG